MVLKDEYEYMGILNEPLILWTQVMEQVSKTVGSCYLDPRETLSMDVDNSQFGSRRVEKL
jgi:hypothetical protein